MKKKIISGPSNFERVPWAVQHIQNYYGTGMGEGNWMKNFVQIERNLPHFGFSIIIFVEGQQEFVTMEWETIRS